MKVLMIFISLLINNAAFQKKNDINFIGTWKVTEVIVDKNSPMGNNPSIMKMLKNTMARVVFDFKPDHHIRMNGGMPGQQVPDGEWNYNASQKTLSIKSGSGPDTRTISMLVTKDAKGQTSFKILNAPVVLKVVKQ